LHGIQENVSKNGAVNAWVFSTIYNMSGITALLSAGRDLALSQPNMPVPSTVISWSTFYRMPLEFLHGTAAILHHVSAQDRAINDF